MLRNYLVTAWRSLTQDRIGFAINIAGLAVGLAACLLILLFARHEMGYDRWVPRADNVYKVHTRLDIPGRAPLFSARAPGPAAEALRKDFPQIAAATRIVARQSSVQESNRVFQETVHLVDPEFFAVFDIPLIAGVRQSALSDTSSVVLSQRQARKLFGTADPLGRLLTIDDNIRRREFRVTGLFADLPARSTLDLGIIGRFDPAEYAQAPYLAEQWTALANETYFRLHAGAAISSVTTGLPEFERRNLPDDSFGIDGVKASELIALSVIALPDVHLFGQPYEEDEGAMSTVWTFCAAAGLIFVIAGFNFMSLSTARAVERAREMALRQVLGAGRRHLIAQFLTESLLVSVLAMSIALLGARLMLPFYGQFLDKELHLTLFGAGSVLPWTMGLVLLLGFAGGLFPALYLFDLRLVQTLNAGGPLPIRGVLGSRRILVTGQFAVGLALIICTMVVYRQAHYVQTMDLGFHKNNILLVRGLHRNGLRAVSETLKEEVEKLPGVTAVTRSRSVPGDPDDLNAALQLAGENGTETALLGRLEVDHDFFAAYGIATVAGRAFEKALADFPPTEPRSIPLVVNAHAVRRLGFASPADAVGRAVFLAGKNGTSAAAHIVGVVADFHYESLREQIRPTFYLRDSSHFDVLSIRFSGIAASDLSRRVEELWQSLAPAEPFRAELLDRRLAQIYARERAQAVLFASFASLAVLIACLGLYGMAALTVVRRTKEIGIRRVMGASRGTIVRLMVWQFSKPVIAANLLAWPAALLFVRYWLSQFEYRIDLGVGPFLIAGLLGLALACATVGGQALRVANGRPAETLRHN